MTTAAAPCTYGCDIAGAWPKLNFLICVQHVCALRMSMPHSHGAAWSCLVADLRYSRYVNAAYTKRRKLDNPLSDMFVCQGGGQALNSAEKKMEVSQADSAAIWWPLCFP